MLASASNEGIKPPFEGFVGVDHGVVEVEKVVKIFPALGATLGSSDGLKRRGQLEERRPLLQSLDHLRAFAPLHQVNGFGRRKHL